MKQLKAFLMLNRLEVILAVVAVSLVGCDHVSSSLEIENDKTAWVQNGAVAKSGTVEIVTEEIPVKFWMNAEAGKGKPDFSFPHPSPSANGERISRKTVTIKGPEAFRPPDAPSPAEKALGWSVGGCTAFALGMLALAAFLAYGTHYKAAGFAGAGAGACLLAAKFLSDDRAMIIGGFFLAIALALFAAWYFMRGRVPVELGGTLEGA